MGANSSYWSYYTHNTTNNRPARLTQRHQGIVRQEDVLPKSVLQAVKLELDNVTYTLPLKNGGSLRFANLTFVRRGPLGWLLIHTDPNIVAIEHDGMKAKGQETTSLFFAPSTSKRTSDLKITYRSGKTVTIKVTSPLLTKIGVASDYHLDTLYVDHYSTLWRREARESFGTRERLYQIGKAFPAAKGAGKRLDTLVAIALDGNIGPSRSGMGANFIGPLSNGSPDVAAGPHGPFYVLLKNNTLPRGNIGFESHVAYLVPGELTKGIFIKAIREAEEKRIISTARAEAIVAKLQTYEEFINSNQNRSRAVA